MINKEMNPDTTSKNLKINNTSNKEVKNTSKKYIKAYLVDTDRKVKIIYKPKDAV